MFKDHKPHKILQYHNIYRVIHQDPPIFFSNEVIQNGYFK